MSELLGRTARRRIHQWLASARSEAEALNAPGSAPDIHIDVLSKRLSNKAMWAMGALEALSAAVVARDELAPTATVALVINFDSVIPIPAGHPRHWSEINQQWFTDTPPELVFLGDASLAHYLAHIRAGRRVELDVARQLGASAYLTELIDTNWDDDELLRHFWMVCPPAEGDLARSKSYAFTSRSAPP